MSDHYMSAGFERKDQDLVWHPKEQGSLRKKLDVQNKNLHKQNKYHSFIQSGEVWV